MNPPDPETAYKTLTTIFNKHLYTPLQLSPLPSSQPSILFSYPHLGIPKPHLLASFTHAHHHVLLPTSPPRDVLDATIITLLLSAEDTTAINHRKRLLLQHQEFREQELALLETLLTSDLQKVNKSPTLWRHRRWVLSTFFPDGIEVERELEVVKKSGEVHSRNYYAWGYARWVCGFCGFSGRLLERQGDWCKGHVSDCGGWGFLMWLVEREGDGERKERCVREVMEYGHEVARGHESLLGFVRTVLGREELLEQERRERLLRVLEGWVECGRTGPMGEETQRELMLEERALRWVRLFGDRIDSPPIH
jgi:hypothetical protein